MDMSLSEHWELVMEREACGAAVHGVTKSQTGLSDWTELNWLRKLKKKEQQLKLKAEEIDEDQNINYWNRKTTQ